MEKEEALRIIKLKREEFKRFQAAEEIIEAFDVVIKCAEENKSIKEKILYELEHPDLQSEKRYGFEGGLMYAREVIEKYL